MSDYKQYFDSVGITQMEAAKALERKYPRFIRGYLSACCNPEMYGLQLSPDAEQYLTETFGSGLGLTFAPYKKKRKRKPFKRKKPNEFKVFLTDNMAANLREAIDGGTVQDYLEKLIRADLWNDAEIIAYGTARGYGRKKADEIIEKAKAQKEAGE